jgi:tetratricopeptide (TPR) repeat protein
MAQPQINKEAIKLVDSANAAFCKNDTVTTIAILESIEKLYPTDGAAAMSNKALADFYIAQGRIKEAKEKLHYGISYQRTSIPVFNKKMEGCSQLFSNQIWLTAKAESCVSLSRLFLQEKKFDSSLYYLQQADIQLNPYQNCGNGLNMYRVYLSPFFVDHYLAMGDTTQAIARLLDFFMVHDGDTEPITKKLKVLLLQKYTQQQIKAGVVKAFRGMAFIKDNKGVWWLNIKMFEHTIKIYVGESKDESYRDYYRNDRSAKMLCAAN